MSETTPLLLGDEAQRQRAPINGSFFQARSTRSICFIIALFSFLLSIAGAIADVPTTRLIEDHICRSYYDEQGGPSKEIDESMCKVDEVQSRMVFLNGWISMIQGTLELLVAFPYGMYADRNGRKPILRLALLGILLQNVYGWAILAMGQKMSINMLLASPLFVLAGGGSTVLVSTMYSIISDVADEANRVNAFLSLLVGNTMGDLVGLLLASYLMVSSPWLPIGLSLIVIVVGACTMVFIPETLPPVKRGPGSDMYDDDDASPLSTVRSHLGELRDQLATAVRMLRQPSLCLVLFAFLCPAPVGMATSTMFIQYVSKRFGWSMASVGYLLSVKTVVNIFVIVVAIPALSRLLMSGALVKSLSVRDKDKILAQAAAFALVVGFALLSGPTIGIVIAGLIVKTFGGGLSSLCRSLATAHTTPENTAKLQTVIGIITTVGMLIAAPTLAFLFSLGMKLGGLMLGLPYAVMTFYLAITAFALCFVRTTTPDLDIIPEAYNLEEVVLCDNASIRSFQSHNTVASSSILLRRSRASSHST
ncbi:hypothetical protein PWT90_07651 [Aphanocladium album]|nr:hypothetical protein PWT90_07651 [Aphanocladium album]